MNDYIKNDRGQVGIGTLIVFIALVLVAAIAAGVLINTAGFLQTQAESTGQESTSQVSNNIEVIGESGNVSGKEVQEVNLTVTRSAGSSDINLSKVSIEYIGDNGFANLISDTENSASGGVTQADGDFSVTAINAESDDKGVITADSDRYQITIDFTSSGGASNLDNLQPGSEATLTFTTESGASREASLSVPSSLVNKANVPL